MDVDISRLNFKNQGARDKKKMAQITFNPDGKITIDLEKVGLPRRQLGIGGLKTVKMSLALDDKTFENGEKLNVLPKRIVIPEPHMLKNGIPNPDGVKDTEREVAIIDLIHERSGGKPVKGVIASSILNRGKKGTNFIRPFMSGGVLDRQKFEKETCEKQIQILSQVVEGMINLHNLGIIHGDIHRYNILLGEDGAVLSDFGWSFDLEKAVSDILDGKISFQVVGTLLGGNPKKFNDWIETLKTKSRDEIRRELKSLDVYWVGKLLSRGALSLNWTGKGCKKGVQDRIRALIKDTMNPNAALRITDEELKTRLEQINE